MIEDLRQALKEKEMVYGTKKTIKKLMQGKVAKVFLASNCPDKVRQDVKHYAQLSGADVVELDVPDEEVGLICKKQFSITVLSY